MSEVARLSGVPASTIQFYLREGLLPAPLKTSRNMAYYDPATVDAVKLIKELQANAFLPLDVVKRILSNVSEPSRVREYLAPRNAVLAALDAGHDAATEDELLADRAITAADLRALAAMGIVEPERRDGQRRYSGEDAMLVRQIARMRAGGLTSSRGFGIERMRIYRDALEALVSQELEVTLPAVVGTVSPDELARVANDWIEGSNELIALLHRKLIRRRLRSIGPLVDG